MTPVPLTAEEYADVMVALYLTAPYGADVDPDLCRLRDAVDALLREMGCSTVDSLVVLLGGGALAVARLQMLFTDTTRWIPPLPAKPASVLRLVPGGRGRKETTT